MCGIAGIIDYNAPSITYQRSLEKLKNRLLHRGPDKQNIAIFTHGGLVHTRLSIIDPQGSQQPLKSEDGRWIMTYNGEIYNYRELKREIGDRWKFETQGDTEVVMAAWSLWGKESLLRLNGMFAFFIWDTHQNKGYLVRDRLGIKPVVWTYHSGAFMFASEAKALIALKNGDIRVNEDSILEYLTAPFFSGITSSMFSGIENLQPGALIEVNQRGIFTSVWADYRLDISDDPIVDLYHALQNAINHTLVADVPLCTFLSGGFDSTLITHQANEKLGGKLEAYTITFTDQENFQYGDTVMTNSNDTPYAVDYARSAGIKHHLVMAETSKLAERIKAVAITNDALPAWEQELAQSALSQAAGKDYKVVLVGDAADETHYGYHFLLDTYATATPSHLMNRFVQDGFINSKRMKNPVGHFDDVYKNFCSHQGYKWDGNAHDNILATTYLIVKRWLPRLLHNGDIHTMKYSLEARVPFGDIDLLEMARKISPYQAYRDGQEKHWLRECSRGLLPENIRVRKKSALPKAQNVASVYKSELSKALKESADFLGYFVDLNIISSLCAQETEPNEKERALMFRLICLAHWRNHYNVVI